MRKKLCSQAILQLGLQGLFYYLQMAKRVLKFHNMYVIKVLWGR